MVLVVGQLFHSLAYQMRLNVVNTLIEGSNKVTGILKEPSLDLDYQDNEYLFGEKF